MDLETDFLEKEFIPSKESRDIRELGFNRPCFRGWDKDGKVWYHPDSDIVLDNPTFSQAFRFFREKYGLCNFTKFSGDGFCSGWEDLGNNEHGFKNYKTYQEAELECLKKLIEFVKKNECRIEK